MPTSLPAYFISHGAPDIAIRNTEASRFLKGWRETMPHTKAILVISAHWMTEEPMITAHPHPETIHDFGGFPKPLYEMRYPAPGNPELALRTLQQLTPAFPLTTLDPDRGLDHGAWIPLILAAPQAEIPVLQLSIQPHRDARHHYEMGKRLASLRDQGVMIVASGSATHNLRAIFHERYTQTPDQVYHFNDWLFDGLSNRDDNTLLAWKKAPDALWNHPTNDHILPLFVALGATEHTPKAERIHHSFDYAVLSMDCYRFN